MTPGISWKWHFSRVHVAKCTNGKSIIFILFHFCGINCVALLFSTAKCFGNLFILRIVLCRLLWWLFSRIYRLAECRQPSNAYGAREREMCPRCGFCDQSAGLVFYSFISLHGLHSRISSESNTNYFCIFAVVSLACDVCSISIAGSLSCCSRSICMCLKRLRIFFSENKIENPLEKCVQRGYIVSHLSVDWKDTKIKLGCKKERTPSK